MALPKPAGTWTYEDLLALPDDGRRYEIIEGALYEMPSPSWEHAVTIANLMLLLGPVIQALGGQLVAAPLDTFFRGADPVQPDMLAILPRSQAVGRGRGVQGPPDFVVEVLSPSNRVHDLLTKRALYSRAGVREYWLVDPAARTIEVSSLDGDVLRTAQTAAGEDAVISPLLGDAAFALATIFANLEQDGASEVS